jgi:hypothetical protein
LEVAIKGRGLAIAQHTGNQKRGAIASASLAARCQTFEGGGNLKERNMPGVELELDVQPSKWE